MKLSTRALLVTLVLGLASAGQHALNAHLAASAVVTPTELAAPLAQLPLVLGPWRGQEEAIVDPRERYADEHVRRTYWNAETRQGLVLWIAYSRHGEDRGHHPEVCLAVAGQREDLSVRQSVAVPGHPQPIQQYRFGDAGSAQWIFYWHYTLPFNGGEGNDALQAAWHQRRVRPASVTVEVFAPEQSMLNAAGARDFVERVDIALQAIVGPTAVRGSDRLPVTVITAE